MTETFSWRVEICQTAFTLRARGGGGGVGMFLLIRRSSFNFAQFGRVTCVKVCTIFRCLSLECACEELRCNMSIINILTVRVVSHEAPPSL